LGVSLSWRAATPAFRRWAIHAVLALLLQTQTLLALIKPKPQGPPVPVLVPLTSVDVLRLSAHRDILWRSQASGSSVTQSCMRSAGIDSKCRKFRLTRIAWRLKAMAAILVS